MIYDCFTFFNELDLLEIRLNTLNAVVDRFVIAEATRTHTGKPKELLFEKNKARYAAFADKIIYIVVDDLLAEEEVSKDALNYPWINENRQRNALIKGIKRANDSDVIMVSDLDEIPRPEAIAQAIAKAQQGEIVRFELEVFVYFANLKDYRSPRWLLGTQMMSMRTFRTSPLFDAFTCDRFSTTQECAGHVIQKVRYMSPTIVIPNAGWHMTYLGGIEAIKRKLSAFAHQEAAKLAGTVEARFKSNQNVIGGGQDFFAVPLDDKFPKYLVEHAEKFSTLITPCDAASFKQTWFGRFRAKTRGIIYRAIVRLVPHCLVGMLSPLYRKIRFR